MPSISRVVEVGSAARLSYHDLQMVVERDGQAPARVPVEDLGIVVLDSAPITMTAHLLAALAEQGACVAVSDARHLPVGLFLPVAGSTLHARTMRAQIAASVPRTKRLWQTIVQAKVREQARLVQEVRDTDAGLGRLAQRVFSGDTTNVEARAARAYFPALLGKDFLRDPGEAGYNAMLNYGYAVLRAAVARAVVGAGLHPALGIHHRSQYDPFALADDLMEPLRPLVDSHVVRMAAPEDEEAPLDQATRHALLELLTDNVEWEEARYPLLTALGSYAACARECLTGSERRLRCPAR